MHFTSLQLKLIVIFGLCVVVAVGTVVLYGIFATHRTERFVTTSSSAVITAAAQELLVEKARMIGLTVEVELEVALDSARTLADVLAGIKDPRVNLTLDRDDINNILRSIMEKTPDFLGAYTLWEPNALDGMDDLYAHTEGYDATGRFIPYLNRGIDGAIQLEANMDYENQEWYENGIRKGEYYLCPKDRQKECVVDPVLYPVQGQPIWMVSLVVPIMVENTFYGIAGIDMRMAFVQALADRVNQSLYNGAGRIAVISHNGILSGVSGQPDFAGKPLRTWMLDDWQNDLALLQAGQEKIEVKATTIEVQIPVTLGRTDAPWAVSIEAPIAALLADVDTLTRELSARGARDLRWQIVVGGGVIGLALLLIWLVSRQIARPLKGAAGVARQVAEGDVHVEFDITSHDEVGRMLRAMQRMMAYLQEVANVAEKVANNDLHVAVTPRSERDALNRSLQKMVTNLRAMRAANERSIAEIAAQNHAMQQQNWVKDGLSQLSAALAGDHLLEETCQAAISFTARYLNAGQGVLYVYQSNQAMLKLFGSFAFVERDALSNTYKLGEGVIGQAALERAPIILKHLESSERLITTGTVSAAPLHTFTFPLVYNDDLYGVIEVASFEPFEQSKLDFLESANRVIATALFSSLQRERVQTLLRQSQAAAAEAERAKMEAQHQTEAAQRANVLLEEKQQELEQQSEELRQMNTRLEEREQELRQQQEELRQQNASLQRMQHNNG